MDEVRLLVVPGDREIFRMQGLAQLVGNAVDDGLEVEAVCQPLLNDVDEGELRTTLIERARLGRSGLRSRASPAFAFSRAATSSVSSRGMAMLSSVIRIDASALLVPSAIARVYILCSTPSDSVFRAA